MNEDVYMPGSPMSIGLNKKAKKKSAPQLLNGMGEMQQAEQGRLAQMAQGQNFGMQPMPTFGAPQDQSQNDPRNRFRRPMAGY